MAAGAAAVLLTAGSAMVALAQEPSSPPEAVPSLMADASAAPVSAASPAPAAETVDGDAGTEAAPRRLIVEAGDLWFAPNEITMRADEPTVLVLTGAGEVAHNLVVDDLGLQLHVGPGIESEIIVSDLPPGTYEFYCSIFGHRRGGMYGTLTIE